MKTDISCRRGILCAAVLGLAALSAVILAALWAQAPSRPPKVGLYPGALLALAASSLWLALRGESAQLSE